MNRTNWVKVSGTLYKKPCALLLGVTDDYPQYGKLQKVYILDSDRVAFYVQILETTSFNSHYHAYVVQGTSAHRVVLHCDLHSPFPSHVHSIKVNTTVHQVVVPKYHICGTLM